MRPKGKAKDMNILLILFCNHILPPKNYDGQNAGPGVGMPWHGLPVYALNCHNQSASHAQLAPHMCCRRASERVLNAINENFIVLSKSFMRI